MKMAGSLAPIWPWNLLWSIDDSTSAPMIPNASPTVAVFTVNLGVEDFGAVMDRGFVMRNAGRLSGRNPGEQPATRNVANAAPTDPGQRFERTRVATTGRFRSR